MPALHLIETCDAENLRFEKQVVDFRAIYTLPKDFVTAYARTLEFRARLLSPYKEHLSQAFARYFIRVGLPRPLLDEQKLCELYGDVSYTITKINPQYFAT